MSNMHWHTQEAVIAPESTASKDDDVAKLTKKIKAAHKSGSSKAKGQKTGPLTKAPSGDAASPYLDADAQAAALAHGGLESKPKTKTHKRDVDAEVDTQSKKKKKEKHKKDSVVAAEKLSAQGASGSGKKGKRRERAQA